MAETRDIVMIILGLVVIFSFSMWLFSSKRGVTVSTVVPTSSVLNLSGDATGAASDPKLFPQTGTIMDGPGFEKGETDIPQSKTYDSIPSNYYFLDDGANGEATVMNNLCSKSCCSDQWATPFKQSYDPYVCANKSKFVPSNIFCNNSFQDSGCLCMTKDQGNFLGTRGGNSPW